MSQAPEKSIEILKKYGYNLGIAFQIIDDVLDFISTEEKLGKPIGSDLAQGTLTLPAMLLMEHFPEDNPVKRLFLKRDKKENIKQAIELIRNSPIIQECYKVASDFSTKACRSLNLLPYNSTRQGLTELANYVLTRQR